MIQMSYAQCDVTHRKYLRAGALDFVPAFGDVLFDFRERADAKSAFELCGVPLLSGQNLP